MARSKCPAQRGLVGWEFSHRAKGHQLDSQPECMPRLWVWSPVGHIREATTQCFSLTLPLSLKKIIKLNLLKKEASDCMNNALKHSVLLG